MTRTFEVEMVVTKWVEVKVPDDVEDDELSDFLQDEALDKFWTAEAWGDDYQMETVKEITAKAEAA
jgi:hypothetical protein